MAKEENHPTAILETQVIEGGSEMIELAGEVKPVKHPKSLYCAYCHEETEHNFIKRLDAGHKSREIWQCVKCESQKVRK